MFSRVSGVAFLAVGLSCEGWSVPRKMHSALRWCLAATCFLLSSVQGAHQMDMSGLVGETVRLPCSVNTERCGDLHSIKWYRGSSRVFVFSEMANIAKAEGDYAERSELIYFPNSTDSFFQIQNVEIADEAMYKCEITYLEVRENCQVVQFINFTTLIKPEYIRITRGDGHELQNSTLIGPLSEDDQLTLICESGGGKPIAAVHWYNGTEKMNSEYEMELGSNGVGTGRNRAEMTLTRGDLGAKFECRASNDALESPLISWIEVDVNVRPLRLELSGVENHVVSGTKVVLQCLVTGARPAANVTWFNGTQMVSTDVIESNSVQTPKTRVIATPDGTYATQSQLMFPASRFENGETLSCEASNQVMRDRNEQPMRSALTLEVMYPPIVNVTPESIKVNESTDILLFCLYEANPATLKTVRWFRNDQEVDINSDHYEGGSVDQPTLLIKNSTRHDHGIYTCVLENEVGVSESINAINVSILFKPVVRLLMEPATPVSELTRANITLVCQVEAGNPSQLQAVKWYLDGELLKELPDCDNNTANCDIDPSKLLLQIVERTFHGNYSCIGMNEAGWGPLSPNTELIVYYPPGPATLVYEPRRVVKNGAVTLSCSVEDVGRPESTAFRWKRGNHIVPDVTSGNWSIELVTLESESNFTCYAVNEGGDGQPATTYIDVLAPPAFIERLPPYYGALINAQHISISCRVECSPRCSINWLKNGRPIDFRPGVPSRYIIKNTEMEAEPRSNDFESTHSVLIWNMTAWPGGQLDPIYDNVNYTCQSTGNSVGVGVKSTTFFGIEYPPDNLTVSNRVVNVIEGNVPEKVVCNAKAYPEASYHWKRETEPSSIVMKGNALILNYAIAKKDGGNYICEAYNRHGNNTIKTYVNVMYKPECDIFKSEVDGKVVLYCNAHANPSEVDFTWKIKNENESISENVEKKGLQSILTLETRVENFRTYLCYVNNSVGMLTIPCEVDVSAHEEKSSKFLDAGSTAWWRALEQEKMLILLAIIISAILMVLIICVVIIIVCRRKRHSNKCPNPSSTTDKSNLNSSPSDALLSPDNDKAFYENLPFHGLQKPPNATNTLTTATGTISRSPSQLSQYGGSSGYGSTRSQLGPHLAQSNSTVPLSEDNKFSSLRTKRSRLDWPQFRSLRITCRNKHMRPIKESCSKPSLKDPEIDALANGTPNNLSKDKSLSSHVEKSGSGAKVSATVAPTPSVAPLSGSSGLAPPKPPAPPVPAPRAVISQQTKRCNTKHTYQNIPIPITPNNSSNIEPMHSNEHNQALHHKLNSHSTLDMQRPNLPHSLTNGRQISSLKKPKSQRSLKHSSSRDESLLLPSYLNTPPPPPYHNGSIVYADLALSRHRVKSLQSIPMYHMEYTAIKFHDVGKEIDV
nr:PREDICTED: hemicentin-1-like isoform X4 [Bemisia tabaci]